MSRYNEELLNPKIISDYHNGLKQKEIAAKHNVSVTTVWKILKKNKLRYNIKWTKELILKSTRELIENEPGFSSYYMQTNHKALHSAMIREFNSFENVIKILGYNPHEFLKYNQWNKEKVISEFKTIDNNTNIKVTSIYLQNNHLALYKAICRYFNNFSDFISEIGYPISDYRLRTIWSDMKMEKKFSKIVFYENLCFSEFREKYPALFSVIESRHGTIRKYMDKLSIDQKKLYETRDWVHKSNRDILKIFDTIVQDNDFKGDAHMAEYHCDLRNALITRFGSLKEAYNKLDTETSYYEFLHLPNQFKNGYKFEKITIDVLSFFKNLTYHKRIYKNANNYIIPDFIDKKTWNFYDCKLSYGKYSIETIEKYRNFTNNTIVIIYMNQSRSLEYKELKTLYKINDEPMVKYSKNLNALIVNIKFVINQITNIPLRNYFLNLIFNFDEIEYIPNLPNKFKNYSEKQCLF